MSDRTLNLGCGVTDKWGTDRLDWRSYGQKDVNIFDLNSRKPLPYKTDIFDEIRLHYLIQILLYPQEVLEECHRVLKVSGKLSLTFPDCESLFYFLFPIRDNPVKNNREHLDNGKTYGIWNMVMMENRLKIAGFKVIEKSKYGRSLNNFFLSNPAIHMVCLKGNTSRFVR